MVAVALQLKGALRLRRPPPAGQLSPEPLRPPRPRQPQRQQGDQALPACDDLGIASERRNRHLDAVGNYVLERCRLHAVLFALCWRRPNP